MKKRLLACLMSVSMVFTLMYGSAVAAEGGGQEKIEEAQEKQRQEEEQEIEDYDE